MWYVQSYLNRCPIPRCLEITRVAPIFRGGERNAPSNYRPISVLPIVSKIFERHINSELNNLLNKKKTIHSLQSGFRAGFPCSTSIHKFVSDTLSCKKQNGFTVALFLDFCKALIVLIIRFCVTNFSPSIF